MSFKDSYKMNRNEELPYYYRLAALNQLGFLTYSRLSEHFGSLKELFSAGGSKLRSLKLLTEGQIEGVMALSGDESLDRDLDRALNSGIKVIPIEDPDYPVMLKEIKDPPLCLFLKGKLPPPYSPTVSVIGARECSGYGESVARRIGELIGASGISLISGMARGVDSISQMAAVSAGGYSLAVLGGGVDVIYPRESTKLYRTLEETGGIISEYVPGTQSLPAFFARRNRLISGLSDAVCVVEAREKSGTLITVDCALEQGREVFAVPGRISDITSFGTNELLRQGAAAISDLNGFVEEILGKYGMFRELNKDHGPSAQSDLFSKAELCIIKNLDDDSFTIDMMGERCGLPPMEILGRCIELAEQGLLIPMGAGRFKATSEGYKYRNALCST